MCQKCEELTFKLMAFPPNDVTHPWMIEPLAWKGLSECDNAISNLNTATGKGYENADLIMLKYPTHVEYHVVSSEVINKYPQIYKDDVPF